MINEYGSILVFVVISVALSGVLLVASEKITERGYTESEKLSAYECGFDAFEDARKKFDVRFYLIGILFIVFDLEASYLFPWALVMNEVGSVGYWTMMDFLFELVIGYIYAWRVGALEEH